MKTFLPGGTGRQGHASEGRAPAEEGRVVEDGDLRIEVDGETALLRGVPPDLSPTEFRLVEALARRMGRIVPREELLSKIWSFYGGDTRTVDVHISRLRKKLDDGKRPALAVNSPGEGATVHVGRTTGQC